MTGSDLDRLVLRFPHGVATRAELLTAGVPAGEIHRRTRPGGSWRGLLPGVYLLSHAPPGQAQLMRAAVRLAGEGSVVSGRYALATHGLLAVDLTERVHVLAPATCRVRPHHRVFIEARAGHQPRHRVIAGLPVTHADRAALDAARRLARGSRPGGGRGHPAFRDAALVLASVIGHGPCDPGSLLLTLGAGGGRGAWLPRAVLRAFLDDPGLIDRALADAVRQPGGRWVAG